MVVIGVGLLPVSIAAAANLSLSATDAVIGQTIHANAQLSESVGASGEISFISFEVFATEDCSGAALTPAPASAVVAGDDEYASGEFSPPSAGTYHWSAHYSGDSENPPADSACSAISIVSKASPGLTGTASAGVVGTAIHDEVNIDGGFSLSGEVTFSVYAPGSGCSTALETTAVPIQGGHATSPDFLPQQAGVFRWKVTYPGDANNEAASSTCGDTSQASNVSKAVPTLSGTATSAVTVGQMITDSATLAGGFGANGELVFRAYGPNDQTCAGAVRHQELVVISGDGFYPATGFAPAEPGLYNWTVEYPGDADNEVVAPVCGAENQASAVGKVAVTLAASASSGAVGTALEAAATIQEGAIPAGQITFKAFPPGDPSCSGAPVFSSVVNVAGNGLYRSAAFVPSRVGSFRWTVGYSGDVNHFPATAGCGKAASAVSQAAPTITGAVRKRLTVGTSFRDTATLQGGYAPSGTITFRIYGPVAAGCAKPVFVDTVAVAGNGTFSSDPFVTQHPGRYSFVASYSGNAANKGVTEPCDSVTQVAQVQKRAPKVKPRARLMGGRQISIRAHLSGGSRPSGVINFRLYRPGDRRCKGKPAFSGAISVDSNGNYSLATYLATEAGIYRLSVGYSGDRRNKRYRGSCSGAQPIRVG
jgi:hypothetical protein